ncbi:hypothetical protein LPJ59_003835 [Coemansia sp. RSA 2399]|nr:hypothetical protein LPJ59_003835 [Coemansia sp. RSA 2399]
MHWGILSDRIGRRPVLLAGLLGDLLTFVLFGLSKSFTWAVVVRCLNGFFTGGTIVIRPILAEISDDTNRARMMGMFPLIMHLGSMLGGAIGGLLADPVKNYPCGLQKQVNSITNMLGPLIWGYLWSWSIKHSFPYPFNSHFTWVLSGILLVISWYISLSIPGSVNSFASDPDAQNHGDPADDEQSDVGS